MEAFATVNELIAIFRNLTIEEQERAEQLLTDVSNNLRYEARRYGYDLDKMIDNDGKTDEVFRTVCKDVTCDIVARILRQDTTSESMSQFSQSAMGYSISGSPAVVGGGVANAILRNDLKRLGIKTQRLRGISLI